MMTTDTPAETFLTADMLLTTDQLVKSLRIREATLGILVKAGLRAFQASPGGKHLFHMADVIAFFRQMAEHAGCDNRFDPLEYASLTQKAQDRDRRYKQKRASMKPPEGILTSVDC